MNLLAYRGLGSFATEVTLTGRYFTAEEALAAGAIGQVAPAGKYFEVARELAAAINKNPPSHAAALADAIAARCERL